MKPMWKPAALPVALTLAAAIARAQISTGATPIYHGTLKIVRPAVGTLDKSTGIGTLRVRGWRWKLKEGSNGIFPTQEPLVVALGEDSFRLDAAAASRGRQTYEAAGCASCHGERGHGDGPSAPQLKDETGLPIRPADLRYPARFKNGAQAIDVYRTLVTGLDGTPMPSYADVFEDPGTLWDLVAYVGSLAR